MSISLRIQQYAKFVQRINPNLEVLEGVCLCSDAPLEALASKHECKRVANMHTNVCTEQAQRKTKEESSANVRYNAVLDESAIQIDESKTNDM